MKTRRHSSIFTLMVASVFLTLLALLTSCGVPTYFVPKFNVSSISNSKNEDKFHLTYTPDSTVTTTSSDHAGLLLIYYYGNSSFSPTDKTNLIKAFKSKYASSSYNGDNIKLDSDDDPVVTYTSSDGLVYNAYAFTLNGTRIQAPSYNYEIDISNTYSVDVTLTYIDPDTDITGDEYVSYQDDNTLFTMQFDPSFIPASDKYIYVFAALCTQSGISFSNIFWSDLKYVGQMIIP